MTDPLRVAAQRLFDAALDSGFPLEEIDHESSYAQRVTLRGRDLDALRAALAPSCLHPDSWFDRSLCPIDDWMHTRCIECGVPLDGSCGE